ncbi:hypothetical protein R3P38DRAFT_3237466 [Favolaschia claudopus]|uniref:Proteophosphoglycan ppg4 n=1 Tax=Favolaschia claudopus TaxID=2862362 RepID=A0AAV9ZAI1_9AGAR
MTFDLRQLPRITSRIVRVEGRVLELWSPNSAQMPFIPGERRPGFIAETPRLLEDRRYDGHLGRFDCLYAPQYWVHALAHWPFVRRQELVPNNDPAYAAYQPLTEVWMVDPSDLRRGEFSSDFLRRLSALQSALDVRIETLRPRFVTGSSTWANRPRYASTLQVSMLSNVRRWQDAVDDGVALQRGLREMEAWITMVEARRCLQPLTMSDLRSAAMPHADDRFIGLWVNGLDEPAVLNFMYASILCFIVHEYPRDAVHRGIADPTVKVFTDFVEGTGLARLLFDNPYLMIARESNMLNLGSRSEEGMGVQQRRSPANEARSSSLYLQRLPVHHATISDRELAETVYQFNLFSLVSRSPEHAPGPSSSQVPFSAPLPPTSSSSTARAPAPTPDVTAASNSSIVLPRAPAPASSAPLAPSANSYAAQEPERQVLARDRVPSSYPAYPSRSRERLGEISAGNCTRWIQGAYSKGREAPDYGEDDPVRSSLEATHLRTATILLPRVFWTLNALALPLHATLGSSSTTTALSPRSRRRDTGKKASRPSAGRLSLISSSRKHSKGKGKAPADDSGEEEDDSDGENDAMDVDEEDERTVPPSNVLMVSGMGSDGSALQFQQRFVDEFHRARASPLAIMRARGAIWLRFATVNEAVMAQGVIPFVLPYAEIAYNPGEDADFADAAQYTQDIWTLQTFSEEMEEPLRMASAPEELEAPMTVVAPTTAATSAPPPAATEATPPPPSPVPPPATSSPPPPSSAPPPILVLPLAPAPPPLAPTQPIQPPPPAPPAPALAPTVPPPSAPNAAAIAGPSRLPLERRLRSPPRQSLADRMQRPLPRRTQGTAPSLAGRMAVPLLERLGNQASTKRRSRKRKRSVSPVHPPSPAPQIVVVKKTRHGNRAGITEQAKRAYKREMERLEAAGESKEPPQKKAKTNEGEDTPPTTETVVSASGSAWLSGMLTGEAPPWMQEGMEEGEIPEQFAAGRWDDEDDDRMGPQMDG